MRILASILLSVCILAIGSGAAEYAHDAEHAREDSAAAKLAADAGRPQKQSPIHDESNCAVHAQLHLPFTAAGWVPLLIALGLIVAFLTEIATPLISRAVAFNLFCRGPPVC